jgi:formylglycine-generating enzyme required for sulfatase activity
MTLTLIQAGDFMMGSTLGQVEANLRQFPTAKKEAFDNEQPQHRVQITRPFYLGTTEVTVGQFRKVVESAGYKTEAERDGYGGFGWNEAAGKFEVRDPKYTWRFTGFEQTDEHPVVNVSWNDAINYCNELSKLEGLEPYYEVSGDRVSIRGGAGYRLPTEAEWEYACRAGTTTRYWSGDDPETLAVENVADATLKAKGSTFADWKAITGRDGYVFTAPVGRSKANSFGLYDMHGNVWEWCGDGYKPDYYKGSPADDPRGPVGSSLRVYRGGGWDSDPRLARSAYRDGDTPAVRVSSLGFRLARGRSGP